MGEPTDLWWALAEERRAWGVLIRRWQQRAILAAKRLLFRDEWVPRRVRFGPGRGLVMLTNRRSEIQKEWGIYECELHPWYRRWAREMLQQTPWPTIFDVGAHDGDTALMLSQMIENRLVIGFEPDPKYVERFRANVALNEEPRKRYCGARVYEMWITEDAPNSIDWLVFDRPGWFLPKPDLVKIDVDGDEVRVLAGMTRTLREVRPRLVIEVHSAGLEQQVLTILWRAGYATNIVSPAWWRVFYGDGRPIEHNRWVVAEPDLPPLKRAGSWHRADATAIDSEVFR